MLCVPQRVDNPPVNVSFFPAAYHEPYYESYQEEDFPALFEAQGFSLAYSTVAHFSKVSGTPPACQGAGAPQRLWHTRAPAHLHACREAPRCASACANVQYCTLLQGVSGTPRACQEGGVPVPVLLWRPQCES